jgi:hypothetical protein
MSCITGTFPVGACIAGEVCIIGEVAEIPEVLPTPALPETLAAVFTFVFPCTPDREFTTAEALATPEFTTPLWSAADLFMDKIECISMIEVLTTLRFLMESLECIIEGLLNIPIIFTSLL